MNWTEFLHTLSERTGVSKKDVHAVMTAAVDVVTEQLRSGADVRMHRLGTFTSRWQAPRTLRQINDHRKIRIDGRYTPAFRAASRLREAVMARTPQRWRDPRHQAAWQLAEALISDLDLYHEDLIPRSLNNDVPNADLYATCQKAFGPTWSRVVETYQTRTPEDIRQAHDYLAAAARNRWIQA